MSYLERKAAAAIALVLFQNRPLGHSVYKLHYIVRVLLMDIRLMILVMKVLLDHSHRLNIERKLWRKTGDYYFQDRGTVKKRVAGRLARI